MFLMGGWLDRQDDGKSRPFTLCALDLNPPVMGLGNPFADGQPQPGSFLGMGPRGVRAVEAVEDPRLRVRRDADPVIQD